jgi:hypothetical protein
MVAALLSVSVPLCCCQGRQVLGLIWGGGGVYTLTVAGGDHHASADHDPASHRSHELEEDHRNSAPPCEDGSCDDTGDCDCGHTNLLAVSPTGPAASAELSVPPLFPMLAGSAPQALTPRLPDAVRARAALVPRPPTSLLRLHCALIV